LPPKTRESSLVFVKPGRTQHINRASEVISYLDEKLYIKDGALSFQRFPILEIKPVHRRDIEKHYVHLNKKPYFKATIDAYLENGLFLTAYRGYDMISRIREAVGDTDPSKAEDYTVRWKFGTGTLAKAKKEKKFLDNAIHASANPEWAKREIKIWGGYFGKYYKALLLS